MIVFVYKNVEPNSFIDVAGSHNNHSSLIVNN